MTVFRPAIANVTSGAQVREWYWFKTELQQACRLHALSPSDPKAELTDRLARFLDTGARAGPLKQHTASRFDWATETLTPQTIITDSCANGPNARQYFEATIWPRFRFNIGLVAWMKANTGKTLADVAKAWRDMDARRKAGERSAIPPSNHYNQYARDFAYGYPRSSRADIRRCWAAKCALPGHNRYERADLAALDGGCAAPHNPV